MTHDARELLLLAPNLLAGSSMSGCSSHPFATTAWFPLDEPEVANDQLDDAWCDELDPLEALASGMPALDHALGSWLFDQLAEDYLDARGDADLTLPDLAKGFAAYLELSRPDHELPREEREPWGDFLVELATFEASWLEISEACELEGHGGMAEPKHARIALQGPWKKVGSWHLALAPQLALHRFRFPVDEYWRAVRRGESPAEPEPCTSYLLIEGHNGLARVRRLGNTAYRTLAAFTRGATLDGARRAAGLRVATFRSLLGRWVENGWLGASPQPALLRQLGG